MIKYESNRKNVDKVMTSSIEKGLLAVGLFIQGRASLLAPVDTGRLRASISYATGSNISRVGPKGMQEDQASGKTPDNEVQVGTNVEYAQYVELGKKKQPFIGPAFQRNIKAIQKILGLELKALDE